MTLCIIGIFGDRTKEEWYAWIKDRVEKNIGWNTPEDVPPIFRTQRAQAQGAQSLFGSNGSSMRNSALSLDGLGGSGLLSAIPRVLGAQGAEEELEEVPESEEGR